ncbi:MAG: hypothetical protein JJE07_04980, partial [Flavobacteriaceae bacterium]|nr:hypothetical protein [Flavobacteriaceae bacterium]
MKYVLSLILALTLMTANAQNYMDIGSVYYSNTPSNKFENSSEQTKVEELGLELNFPVVLNEKDVLLT